MEGGPSLSRRNSIRSAGGSRRGSAVIEVDIVQADQASIFGTKKPLKKSKPVSSVKINFMGKPIVCMCVFLEHHESLKGANYVCA